MTVSWSVLDGGTLCHICGNKYHICGADEEQFLKCPRVILPNTFLISTIIRKWKQINKTFLILLQSFICILTLYQFKFHNLYWKKKFSAEEIHLEFLLTLLKTSDHKRKKSMFIYSRYIFWMSVTCWVLTSLERKMISSND